MDETSKNGQPPIDVAAITKSVTDAVTANVTKSVTEAVLAQVNQVGGKVAELENNLGIVSDTVKSTLSTDSTKQLIKTELENQAKAQAEAAQKTAARKALIDQLTKDVLGGSEDLAANLVGDDEAALTESANRLAAAAKKIRPDFGSQTDAAAAAGDPATAKPKSWVKYA